MGNTFQKTDVNPTKPMIALIVNRLNNPKAAASRLDEKEKSIYNILSTTETQTDSM